MPELPDVEAFREVLASCAKGRRIERVDVRDPGVLHGVSARKLRRELEGRRFTEPERHGKWLLARTESPLLERSRELEGGPTVMLHFGMTGQLVCCAPDDAPHPHDRVLFTVGRDSADRGGVGRDGVGGDRQLRYRDQRKLQGLWLADDTGVARVLDRQGPDAMAVDRDAFDTVFSGRRGRVKAVLTDQSVLAGLGNLLADEILWRAGLHPAIPAAALTDAQRGRLYKDMRRTLRSSISAGCVPPRRSWLTGHRDDSDATCPRCGEPLRRDRIGGRGTVWCPRCQPTAA
uniref:Fpg/Nei family DNA glycosylase n=1 Tax=Streptomyces himalayensis subsp. aureolus TaxID=2758039 RepID=A0A7W2D775_9ACTN|nr:Fpg/Nei family DNA glycosylase [Streptomyces himalayensis]MBA4866045.1 Fpg/Nei family DNA glycosylase [Streptomyces himalayensis subsp. aureolus]